MKKTEVIIESYPRTRPELNKNHKDIYELEYKNNRDGKGFFEKLSKFCEAWMHKRVATIQGDNVLELGAGTLNHIKYEKHFRNYDIVEPMKFLYSDKMELKKINRTYSSQKDIKPGKKYDKILSVAVLEHMTDLPSELEKSQLLLKSHGVFMAGIPSEGGFLWWMGWRFTTGISYYLRNKLDYGELMRHEHVNTAAEIEALVRHYFKNVTIERFPFNSLHFSLYTFIKATNDS